MSDWNDQCDIDATGCGLFYVWLTVEKQTQELARKAERVDIYTNTLDSARDELLDLIGEEMAK